MATDNKDGTAPPENQKAGAAASTVSPVKSKAEPTVERKEKTKLKAKAPAKSAKPARVKVKKSAAVIAWLALLIALLALMAVAYGLWVLQLDKRDESLQQNRLQQAQVALTAQVASTGQRWSSQLQSVVDDVASQRQQVSDLQAGWKATSRQVGEVTQVNRRSWMLAEVEYLLRLANQRLILERETYSALALLNSADKILVAVAEPGLFEVRQALARETAALRAMPTLDVEGVFVTLAALSEQVQSLALLTPPAEENVAEAANIALQDAPKEGQKTVFAAALAYFNDKVAIRHRAKALAPLLTPEQHYYVQQNLRLMLEQAQLALLQRQSGVYTRSLDKAMRWLDEYFQLNQAAQRLRASLGELQQLQIAAEAPDISASLLLLKAYLSAPVEVAKSAAAAPQTEQPEQQKSTTEVVQ